MNRRGSVLIVVLLGLLVIEALIAGSLAVATTEVTTYGLRQRQLQARLSAESAVRALLADWPEQWADTANGSRARVGASQPDSGPAEIEALGPGRFIVRGFADTAATARPLAAALVSSLVRDSVRALLGAAIRSDGAVVVGAGAAIDGLQEAAAPARTDCPPESAMPGLMVPPAIEVLLDPSASLLGAPPLAMAAPETTAATLEILGALADHTVTGVTAPGPGAADGECMVADPANWGDLDGTTPECGDHLPLIFAPGDLHITGGSGQGTLLVLGELRIDDNFRFQGVILARSLRLGRSIIRGAVRTFGADTTRIDGRVMSSGCDVERAIGASALARPFRSTRWWLPVR
jgi:hypothetical protein